MTMDELPPAEAPPGELAPRAPQGFEKALSFVLLPPVLVWETARAIGTGAVAVVGRTWLAAGALATATARAMGAPWRLLVGIAKTLASAVSRFARSIARPVTVLAMRGFRTVAELWTRVGVLSRSAAAAAATVLRRLAGAGHALWARLATLGRAIGTVTAQTSRVVAHSAVELLRRSLAALRAAARPTAVAVRAASSTVAEGGKRFVVAVRALGSVVVRTIAGPVKRMVVALTASVAGLGTVLAAAATRFSDIGLSVWLSARKPFVRFAAFVQTATQRAGAAIRRVAASLQHAATLPLRLVAPLGHVAATWIRATYAAARRVGERLAEVARVVVTRLSRKISRMAVLLGQVVSALAARCGAVYRTCTRVAKDVGAAAIASLRPLRDTLHRVGSDTWRRTAGRVRATTHVALERARTSVRSSAETVRAALRHAGIRTRE
jgi:hypothetical protein